MKTIIAGCRDWTDAWMVGHAISGCSWNITEIVSGGARGADKLGERWAKENDVPLRVFPADWDSHGKAAGPIRNKQMAVYADAILVFWDGQSRGTKNMIGEAVKQGLTAVVHIVPRA